MISVEIHPDIRSLHADEIFAGLWELVHKNKISLKYVFKNPFRLSIDDSDRENTVCALLKDDSNQLELKVCFDVKDGPNVAMNRLKACDYYFKRSFDPKQLDKLNSAVRSKILPYGLNYKCTSKYERKIARRTIIHHYSSGKLKRDFLSCLVDVFKGYTKKLLLTYFPSLLSVNPPLISKFECTPDSRVEPLILFQAFVYNPEKICGREPREVKELMDNRANIVRILRKRFPREFVGGIVPSDFAREHYPDCITSLPTDRMSYLRLVARSLIGVMTTGLHDSIGGKLPEYLASSKCVVSEPLLYELPNPLRKNVNYIVFNSPNECVKACQTILANPSLAEDMRKANYNYYQEYVRPPSKIWACIARSLAL